MPAITTSLPQSIRDAASWLVNAGADDMKHSLDAMTGTEKDITILTAAIEAEKSQPKSSQRVTRLKPMEAKLARFQKSTAVGPNKTPLEHLADKFDAERASEVEIVTASQVDAAELAGLAESISRSREIIHKHEQACHETTLEHYLDAGQMLARAQEIFTLSNSDKTAAARGGKALLSRRDNSEPETSPEILATRGFSAWLADALPDLKRPTAIKYATAYRSLGLPLTAKPAEIRAKLKTLRHQAQKAGLPMPTLASVLKAAPKPEKPKPLKLELKPDPLELRVGDAREFVHTWISTWDTNLKAGRIEDLPAAELPALYDFVTEVRDHLRARMKSAKIALR